MLALLLGGPGIAILGIAPVLDRLPDSAGLTPLLVPLGYVAGGLALLLFTAAVSVYVFAPVRRRDWALATAPSYLTILGCLYLAIFAAFALSPIYRLLSGEGLGDTSSPSPAALFVAASTQNLAILAILYFRLVRPGFVGWPLQSADRPRFAFLLLAGALTFLVVFVVQATIGYLLSLVDLQNTQQLMFSSLHRATPLELVGVLFAVSLFTGVVEEWFFRGYVFRALHRAKGPFQGFVISSLIFAVLHVPPLPGVAGSANFVSAWLALIVPVFAVGLIFAYAYQRSGSLVPSIVAHMMNNAWALAVVYFVGATGQ